MCLGIPVKVKKIKGNTATVSTGSVEKQIGIELTPDVKVGDYVLLHAGFAIEIINEKVAQETLKLLEEMFSMEIDDQK
ncbi:MAG: HypC/HybG/HupF family hydrogenase formation chaperone [Candidatus Omnitrophota bacterium]